MRLLVTWVINALALLALPYLFHSIHVASFANAMIAALVGSSTRSSGRCSFCSRCR
jgi:uncharacterized membrane protein YvlD (DUF360 family)